MDPRVQKVINLIGEDICLESSLSTLAHLVNLSPSRLRYLFKTEIGIPPAQYLKSRRMNRAEELLETTFLSVKEIIASIGINDQSHFVREFKKTHGVTPAQYRMRLATQPTLLKREKGLDGLFILVVEDDLDTRELIGILLERAGARVKTLASAAEALTALERLRPHLLIVDIGLPGQDGYGFIDQARALFAARGQQIPAVALTAYASSKDREQALGAGFQVHLPKPPLPGQLINVILQLTNRAACDPEAEICGS